MLKFSHFKGPVSVPRRGVEELRRYEEPSAGDGPECNERIELGDQKASHGGRGVTLKLMQKRITRPTE
jgi:hypothetical protein